VWINQDSCAFAALRFAVSSSEQLFGPCCGSVRGNVVERIYEGRGVDGIFRLGGIVYYDGSVVDLGPKDIVKGDGELGW
jgi:hypothetical protein